MPSIPDNECVFWDGQNYEGEAHSYTATVGFLGTVGLNDVFRSGACGKDVEAMVYEHGMGDKRGLGRNLMIRAGQYASSLGELSGIVSSIEIAEFDPDCLDGQIFNYDSQACERDCPSGQYYSARFDVCSPNGLRAGRRGQCGYRNSYCDDNFDCCLTEHKCYPLFRFDRPRCMDARHAPSAGPPDGGSPERNYFG